MANNVNNSVKPIETSFQNLYKKMDATSKTRFHASRRLRLHSKFSVYAIVGISLGLILVTLMQAYSLGNNIDNKEVGLFQAFSSIAVLVYSLLIERNNYASISEKMYSCGSQLGELKQEVHLYVNLATFNNEKYIFYKNQYHQILKLFETHSNNDFRADYLRAKLEMPEHYTFTRCSLFFTCINIYVSYFLDFLSYIIVLLIMMLSIYFIAFH